MKKCERCGKPLTEFEIAFHREASSPPAISGMCWSCSGGEQQFSKGYVDKPHHRVEILVCLLAIALIVGIFMPLLPYWNSYELPADLNNYLYVSVVCYSVVGIFVMLVIRRKKGNKPTLQEWDPPTTRYRNVYGPNTDIYTTKINRDGDFVTTKETRLGGRTDDLWGAHASTGSSAVDKMLDFYKKLLVVTLTPCLYLLGGVSFIFWVVPYILVVAVRDIYARGKCKNVPVGLQRAYRRCRKLYGDAPVTYDDKVGFLVSRENHKAKKNGNSDSFLSHFQQAEADESAPFFFTSKKGVSYMIVDYTRDPNKNYGTTFLLVYNGKGEIQKRIAVGNGFLPVDSGEWEHEWNVAGVSLHAKNHLDWYEQKMKKILKSPKRNREIVG